MGHLVFRLGLAVQGGFEHEPFGKNHLAEQVKTPDQEAGIAPLEYQLEIPRHGHGPDHGVQYYQRLNILLVLDGVAKSDGAAPVLTHRGDALHFQPVDQPGYQLYVTLQRILSLTFWFVGKAETHQIGDDAAVTGRHQRRDHLPIQVAPGGLPMEHQNYRSISLIQVMKAHPIDL